MKVIWTWAREEATGNLCLESKTLVQARATFFSVGWPDGETRSNGATGPSYNQGPKGSREIPSIIPDTPKIHIPPWPWFWYYCRRLDNMTAGQADLLVSSISRYSNRLTSSAVIGISPSFPSSPLSILRAPPTSSPVIPVRQPLAS